MSDTESIGRKKNPKQRLKKAVSESVAEDDAEMEFSEEVTAALTKPADVDMAYDGIEDAKAKEKTKKKRKEKYQPAPVEDESGAEEDDDAPQAKKQKRAESTKETPPAAADKKEEEDSDHEDDDSGDAARAVAPVVDPNEGLIQIRAPRLQAIQSREIPPGTSFVSPNNTLRYWSLKYGLNIHYTEINPKVHLSLKFTKPGKGYTKSFTTVTCTKDQKFDFTGGNKFVKDWKSEFVCIGAFGVVAYPSMWPYGNRDPRPGGAAKFTPADSSKIRMLFSFTNQDYAASLAHEKPNKGTVDFDADMFVSRFFLGVDSWAAAASWGISSDVFPLRRAALEAEVQKEFDALSTEYDIALENWESDMEKWKEVKKNKAPQPKKPVKPDLSAAKKEEALRVKFLQSGIYRSASVPKGQKYTAVTFQAPLLVGQTVKEREAKTAYNGKDPWFQRQFTNPDKYKTKNDKGEEIEKDGFPKVMRDVPFYRAFTRDEAAEYKKQGKKMPDNPYVLVPWENRFVVRDDVVAPIWGLEKIDSISNGVFRVIIKGVIWLGERGRLNEAAVPVEGVDPRCYFLTAQRYERTRENFNPKTVENSTASTAASAEGSYVPAGSNSMEELVDGFDPNDFAE